MQKLSFKDNPDFNGAIMKHPDNDIEFFVAVYDINAYTNNGYLVVSFSNDKADQSFNGKNPIYTGADKKDHIDDFSENNTPEAFTEANFISVILVFYADVVK